MYIDSVGCTACKLKLSRWKTFISQIDSIPNKNISYVFYFMPKSIIEVQCLLKQCDFKVPVCIEKKDEINKLNNFPDNIMFQTFLLNKENEVVLIGNPIHNDAVKKLYIETIRKKKILK